MGRYTVRILWSALNPNFLTIDCFPSLGMSQNEITANILTFVFMKRDFLKDYCVEKVSFSFHPSVDLSVNITQLTCSLPPFQLSPDKIAYC